MDDESKVLNELVKAKESIKRKYNTLKYNEANVRKLMKDTFKPIIDPLTKISNTSALNHFKSLENKSAKVESPERLSTARRQRVIMIRH